MGLPRTKCEYCFSKTVTGHGPIHADGEDDKDYHKEIDLSYMNVVDFSHDVIQWRAYELSVC
jgi:hypothetical protein